MSLTFKSDLAGKNNPEKNEVDNSQEKANDIERYTSASGVRTLCLVELSGKKSFFNYSYLVHGHFLPEDNCIILYFTTHIITFKGQNIEMLFEDFMNNVTKKVVCIESRYASLKHEKAINVTEILIQKKARHN